MKLSKLQSRVIQLMKEGWKLSLMWSHIGHTRISYRSWLQKEGLVEDVDMRTFNSLRNGRLIESVKGFSDVTQYILTDEGRKVE